MSPAGKKTAAKARRRPKKDTKKLARRFAVDFAAPREVQLERTGVQRAEAHRMAAPATEESAALLRLRALEERDAEDRAAVREMAMPVDVTRHNWTPMGPLAVPFGQTYGGARVLISGRVTAIAPHPTNGDRIYIGTSRGGVWRTEDAGQTWTPLGDDQPSLAIGALAIGVNDPQVLYAGTGEGNLQLYSSAFPLSSAPGVYLGIGLLRSTDGGISWVNNATTLLANHSFYRIAVDPADADHAFAATSRGLCRTTDGVTWALLTGGGLPAIAGSVRACTDVLVDSSDASGNTVYAAFWGSGIYRSTDALAASPTFTLLTTGLPAGGTTSRISLKQSTSSPAHKYALIADNNDALLGLYRTTTTAGTTWQLCTNSPTIELYGAFTSDVNVDPTTPDVVYVSGVELYKCQRNVATGAWSVSNVGGNIHPDSHTFAFHPTLNQTIYSGNDGGFYVSHDGGSTWDDTPNEGLCLMQYEAIDNHGTSDALVQCGTQDNGTQQYRNSPVHYHSADGDGGYCTVSKVNGNNVTHSYYGNSPRRSTAAGKFGTYTGVATGLNGSGLFYPPSAISPSSERMAWATTVVNIDDAMGSGGWPGAGVALPGINGRVSAVWFANDSLVYCATTSGQVYRLDLSGGTWTARTLHAAPLPVGQWIWDIQALPGNDNIVVVAFSGFGLTNHVWRGTVPANGTATWAAVSGGLPDVPMYALCLPSATEWFVGTDIGVFRTTNSGTGWINYSQGLPNTAIYDLRLRTGSSLLRAATHGRGLWEIRTDVSVQPEVDLFLRDHVMDTGRGQSGGAATAAWEDPTRYLSLNTPCYWWECADIKTDAPPNWQLLPSEVNYLNFETKLVHENPEKGNQNRVYVQVHNRGPLAASDVTVKVMTAGASAGLPDLPADFWATWPNSPGDANWAPVGSPQTIATLEPLRPTVLEWTWTPPIGADTHTCMLVVIDSPSDPMPDAAKVFQIGALVTGEKRVGLKNLHVVNLLPDAFVPIPLYLYASSLLRRRYVVRLPAFDQPDLRVTMLFSSALSKRVQGTEGLRGLTSSKFSGADLSRLKRRWLSDEMRTEESWERLLSTYDVNRQYRVDRRVGLVDVPLGMKAGGREEILLLARGAAELRPDSLARATVQQLTTKGELVGGSTFVFKPAKG
ncbi:MAG: WD40/YVTN/BNR-like repeat-containing protein [Nocardioidaceae bacterium]